ncbi:MAG: OmpA family protein [Hyphomicrobiales bacterium]
MWKCRPSAWIWPGILAVGLLLLISMFLKAGSIETDLTKRALGKLSSDHPWASVELDGRDLSISGVAPSLEAKQDALKIADGVFRDRDAGTWGVRVVDGSGIDELAVQSPFVTSGKFDGSTITLSGYVGSETATGVVEKEVVAAMPDTTVVNELQAAGGSVDGLGEQIGFAVGQVKELASGEFKITDSSLDISGVAKNNPTYDAVNAALSGSLPAGLSLGSADIKRPAASPYVFYASKSVGGIVLSGSVPNGEVREALNAKAGEIANGGSVTDNMVFASGAASNYQEGANFAIEKLRTVENGSASISGNDFRFKGNFADRDAENAFRAKIATGVVAGLAVGNLALSSPEPAAAAEVVAVPEPAPAPIPAFSPYIFGAQKSAEGIVLEGNVPSEDARTNVVAQAGSLTDGSVTDNLTVADDAPANFDLMTSFGLAQFNRLDTAELSTFGDTLSLKGSATSPAAQRSVVGSLDAAPTGLNIGSTNIGVTPVSPFTYGATVGDDASQITLTGNVSSDTSKGALVSSAKGAGFETVVDQTEINAGAPSSFVNAASFANKMVSNFSEGSVQISDQNISINGVAKDAASYTAAHASADRIAAGYKLVEKNIALPTASPYRFSAVKNGGEVSFNGSVPSDAVKIGLSGAGGSKGWNVTDASTLANGAPAGFVGATQYGNDMLAHFTDGSVRIEDTDIFIDGTAATSEGYNIATADAKNPPEGFTVVSAEIDRTPVSPFTLNASKKDGVNVSGFSPSREASIVMTAGANRQFGSDLNSIDLAIEAGAPAGFSGAAVKGFEGLAQLNTGSLAISDTTATLYGVVPVSGSLNDIKDSFEKGLPEGFTGTAILSQLTPPPAPVEPEPAPVSPFTLNASKKDGVKVSGLSPSREASIVMTAGANRQFGSDLNSIDLTIEAGAPAGFSGAAVKGFEGLAQLNTGSLAISDTTATLYGVVPVSGSLNDIKDGFEKGLPEGFTGTAILSQVTPPPAPVTPEPVACSAGILETIAKNKIFFQSAKAGILSDSFGLLDGVAAQIISCPEARFEVGGHTDSDGSESFNQRLSEARAKSVVDYLVNAGVSADRLNAVGYGETNPVVVNNSRENKAKNRRIEFSLIKAN